MGNYRDLKVWSQAVDLAVETYRVTARFPPQERYGLTSQMRRAAVSVSSNIAEGSGRRGPTEVRRFLTIARGSLHELGSQAHVARRLGFLVPSDWEATEKRIDAISRMLLTLIRRLTKAS